MCGSTCCLGNAERRTAASLKEMARSLGNGCIGGISPGRHFCFVCFRAAALPRAGAVSFALRQPRRIAKREAKQVQATVSREATVLIVDDEPCVREVLEEYLVGH